MNNGYLQHSGILGQKWGVRRYQNEDGTYTEEGKRRLRKMDQKWLRKNDKALKRYAQEAALNDRETQQKIGKINEQYPGNSKKRLDGKYKANYTNAINRVMAESMSKYTKDIRSPSGKIVTFIAATGSTKLADVYTAIADEGYDMSKVSKGINKEGKFSYKKKKAGNYVEQV